MNLTWQSYLTPEKWAGKQSPGLGPAGGCFGRQILLGSFRTYMDILYIGR